MSDLNKPGEAKGGVQLSPRAIVGIAIAVVCLIFVFSNTGKVSLRFLWIEITAAGWILLFLLLALGFLAGFMIGRNRYKKAG